MSMAKLRKDGLFKKSGRPPIFKTEQEFRQALLNYLTYCEENKKIINIAGFCAKNGFGRDVYYDYGKKYPHTKKAFEASLEAAWVERLAGANATGAIFYLKNAFREFYKDRTETDITSKGEKILGIDYITPKNGGKKVKI